MGDQRDCRLLRLVHTTTMAGESILFCVVWFYTPLLADSVAIDNGIAAGPEIQCDSDAVTLMASTRNPFTGRLYVKGESTTAGCSVNYTQNASLNIAIVVPLTECNVRRVRVPGGAFEYTTTVVISFHRMFETKVDRAYRVHCVFTQLNNTFTAPSIEVSMIPTTETLSQTAGMAQCQYEIRRGSVEGPILRFATIGEPVFHVWKCQTAGMRILVRDCYVDDGGGNQVATVDSNGCALDRYLIQTPTYVGPDYTTVYTEAHVFKYADRPTVLFQCQIQFCEATDASCQETTPPTCNGSSAPTSGPLPVNYTGASETTQNYTTQVSPTSANFTTLVTEGVENAPNETSVTGLNTTVSPVGVNETLPPAPPYPGYPNFSSVAPSTNETTPAADNVTTMGINETSSSASPSSTEENTTANATLSFPTPGLMILPEQGNATNQTDAGQNATRRIRRTSDDDTQYQVDSGLWDVVSNELTVMDLEQESKHAGDSEGGGEFDLRIVDDNDEKEPSAAESLHSLIDQKSDPSHPRCVPPRDIALAISVLATLMIISIAAIAVYWNFKHGRKCTEP